jgi:two-component system, NtrC family, response regulator AtoC
MEKNMSAKYNALILDDVPDWQKIYKERLDALGIFSDVKVMSNGEAGLAYVEENGAHLVVSDLFMKPNYDEKSKEIEMPDQIFGGAWLIREMAERCPETPILLISDKSDARKVRTQWLLKYRNYKFVDKDKLDRDLSYMAREAILKMVTDRVEVSSADERLIIGDSPAMMDVYSSISKCTKNDVPVLVTGETGTGKELVAKEIHANSARAKKPFIPVNCAAFPEHLLESELFGYEKGAFTGAARRKLGYIERANGGTLFLDEVGDMSPPMQAKLLRVLQDKNFTRLGGETEIQSDFRLIAATHRDLVQLIEEEEFRQDLYYRINVLHIKLPPLRERQSDISLLVEYFLKHFSEQYGMNIPEIEPPAIERLKEYAFPGNIRELENLIQRGITLSDGNTIKVKDLRLNDSISKSSSSTANLQTNLSLHEQVELFERNRIVEALVESEGNRNMAIALLDIKRATLNGKIEKYKLEHHVTPERQRATTSGRTNRRKS